MKVLDNLLRFFAALFMALVVFLLPLALFGRSLGKIAFSSETIKGVLAKHIWNYDSAATVAEQLVDTAALGNEQREPLEQFMLAGLSNLNHQQWLQLFTLVAPEDMLKTTLDGLVDGFYTWLDNDSAYPQLSIDARSWKSNASANAVSVLELVLNTMPDCTAEQLTQYAAGGDILNAAQIPLCRPPEPFYGLLLTSWSVVIPTQIQALPDNINLIWRMNAEPDQMLHLKTQLRRMRAVLRWSWLVVLLLFIIAIPLGARSIPGAFVWAGVPLVLSGGVTVIGALLLFLFSDTITAAFTTSLPTLGTLEIFNPFQAALFTGVSLLYGNLAVQVVLQFGFGGGALGAAFILQRVLKPHKVPVMGYDQSWESGQVTYYEDHDPYR